MTAGPVAVSAMTKPENVLVIGAPRSGTTLVAGLLSASGEGSPMLPECTYITQIIRQFYNTLHFSDPQRFAAYAIDEPTLVNMYRGMVDSMLDTVRSHFRDIDYRYLILKDPELTQLLDLIPVFFGEGSKTVCVIRDPRDVMASMLEIERKKKKNIWSAWLKAPSWLLAGNLLSQQLRERALLSDIFMYYWRVQDSQLYKNAAVHLVCYEKIVARDEDEFVHLEEYLGFPVGRKGFGETQFGFNRTDPTFSAGYGGAIQSNDRDFRKTLSPRQVKKIETAFAGLNYVYKWWE